MNRESNNLIRLFNELAAPFLMIILIPIIFKIFIIPILEGLMFTFFINNFEFGERTVNIIKKALELISDGILYLRGLNFLNLLILKISKNLFFFYMNR